ncbi:hypothetical protein protein, partial [Bacillus cereus G9241]
MIAYPVVPPNDKPILTIKKPTMNGFNPSANLFAPIANIPNTKTNVPIISLKRFANVFGIAGPVANTPNFVPGSSV